jgi:prevent-host-death family protein
MRVINVHEAKTHLSRLLEDAVRGEEIVLGKHGRPMATLVPYAPLAASRPLGGMEGRIVVAPDFDEEDHRIDALFGGESA